MGTLLVVPGSLGLILTVVSFAGAVWSFVRARGLRLRLRLLEARDRERNDVMSALAEASRASPEAVLERLDAGLRALEPAADALLVYVPRGDELECVRASGTRTQAYLGSRLRRDGDRLPARAARARHRLRLDGDGVLPFDRDAIGLPLRDGDGVLGVAYLASRRARFERPDALVEMAERAAPAYAIALERARDRRSATYDGLTGLLTPHVFRARLREALGDARRREHLSLWFIDTDEFKSINDSLGHGAGDLVLARMAELLRAHTDDGTDVAARNGGDEFCALLRATPKSLGIERAEAFRRAVGECDFGIGRRLSASVGVAAYPLDADTASLLLERADAAMYHSKRTGRDRVSFLLAPDVFMAHLP
jgi:diguanylate cyclase (GGDEF)-like protein